MKSRTSADCFEENFYFHWLELIMTFDGVIHMMHVYSFYFIICVIGSRKKPSVYIYIYMYYLPNSIKIPVSV